VWEPDLAAQPDLKSRLLQSMIDFMVALRASAYFGNFYSTMGQVWDVGL
jgi:hypothetical protein